MADPPAQRDWSGTTALAATVRAYHRKQSCDPKPKAGLRKSPWASAG